MCEPLEPRRLLAVSNGLNAVYFSNRDFTGASGTRRDATIALEASSAQFITPRVQALTFSARWHGLVKALTTETYTFATRNNDGSWQLLRLGHLDIGPTVDVGVMCCSPERAGLVATFRDFQVGPPMTGDLE